MNEKEFRDPQQAFAAGIRFAVEKLANSGNEREALCILQDSWLKKEEIEEVALMNHNTIDDLRLKILDKWDW